MVTWYMEDPSMDGSEVQDQAVQRACGPMVAVFLVPPVPYVARGVEVLYHNGLLRLSQCDGHVYLVLRRYAQGGSQPLFFDRCQHAPAQAHGCGSQQYGLGSDAVIAVHCFAYVHVVQYDYIRGRPLPFCRAVPVREGCRPGKVLEDDRVLLRMVGENIAPRLTVRRE